MFLMNTFFCKKVKTKSKDKRIEKWKEDLMGIDTDKNLGKCNIKIIKTNEKMKRMILIFFSLIKEMV